MVRISGRLMVSLNALLQLDQLVQLVTTTNWLRQCAQREGRAKCTCYKIQPSVLSCSSWYIVSLQCPEPSCSMAALASMTHNRTWRWPSGRLIRECTVYQPQDQSPRRLIGTTHKAMHLVSRNNRDEVNQTAVGGRASTLTFQSYQQSQGGKYECRVVCH